MIRPKVATVILYILLKYVLFYLLMMVKNNNYTFLKINEIENGEDLFMYLYTFLSLPFIFIVLLTLPLYYSLKVRKTTLFFILLVGSFCIEYFVYTYLASQLDYMNGIYNALIGLALFFVFYYRTIKFNFSNK